MSEIITDVEAYRLLLRQLGEAQTENERLQSCLYAQEAVPPLYEEIRKLRAEIEQLRALLDAVRICFKNRDQSEREAALYTEIRRALSGKDFKVLDK
jgi:hypothetical protein